MIVMIVQMINAIVLCTSRYEQLSSSVDGVVASVKLVESHLISASVELMLARCNR